MSVFRQIYSVYSFFFCLWLRTDDKMRHSSLLITYSFFSLPPFIFWGSFSDGSEIAWKLFKEAWHHYDTLQDSVEFVIHQFLKILSHYQCVCLSYVYPFVCLCLKYILVIYMCLCWSIYRSVTRLKAILLFDKQNDVIYSYAEL